MHNKPHTEKGKKNISNSRKGKCLGNTNAKGKNLGNTYGFKKGGIPWNKDKAGTYSTSLKGIKYTEEQKKRMNFKGLELGRGWSKGTKGIVKAWNKGKKGVMPPAWSKGLSAKSDLRIRCGENINTWKGGITPENQKIRHSIESRLWREAVFARDNWTCQKTGIKGEILHPHHINNFAQFPELRFAIDNGITLSEKAHQEFHKKYGKRNNTREQLEEFIKDD